MRIEELYLKNFRNIEEHSFKFPARFSVIIGKNGSGKSAILHALRVAAGAYFLGLKGVDKRHIHNDEIRQAEDERLSLNPQYPVVVEAKGQLHGSDKQEVWKRQVLNEKNSTTSSYAEIGAIKEIAADKYEAYKDLKDPSPLNLPVIAYFGTERLHGASRKRPKGDRIGRMILKEGYHNWDNIRSKTYQYREWIGAYEVLLKEGKERAESMKIFEETLKAACPFINDISTLAGQLRFRVSFEKNGGSISPMFPPHLHSDGVEMLVEMVAEIAFRCIVLNGELREDAIRESRGIVMIDELDIHLHPSWQKSVVQNLKDAFPNLQFVVTSHSPFIVQSLEEEELINLEEITGNHQTGLDDDPKNYNIIEVIQEEMGVDERSDELEEREQIVEEYKKLVREGKSSKTDEEVRRIRQRLDELELRFSHDPAYVAVLQMKRATGEV